MNSHRHGDPFRFRLAVVSAFAALVTAGWLGWNSVSGSPEIYQAGPLSPAHQGLADRCDKCHDMYAPLQRLVSLGIGERVTAAPDAKCEQCHSGSGHYYLATEENVAWAQRAVEGNLVSGHSQACSDCHSEHQQGQDLRRVTNHFCVECHGDLNAAGDHSAVVVSPTLESSIPDFEGHPPFAVTSLTVGSEGSDEPSPTHSVYGLVRRMLRTGENEERWQDRADIRFNHAVHLREEGVFDAKGERHVLTQNCSFCHQPDPDRKGMRPVTFKQHCQSCHPLVFEFDHVRDTETGDLVSVEEARRTGNRDRYEMLEVPHRQLDVVRGFLTDFYAVQQLVTRPPADPKRPRPGYETLTDRELDAVELEVEESEKRAIVSRFEEEPDIRDSGLLQSVKSLRSSGGCGFCHTVEEVTTPGDQLSTSSWAVRPTEIPDKWFVHAEFDHDAHRFAKCTDCHTSPAGGFDIFRSESTGDVLLPGIHVCRSCHTSQVTEADAIPARTDCVECHVYHKREHESHPLAQSSDVPEIRTPAGEHGALTNGGSE